jgi:hypothetical protein
VAIAQDNDVLTAVATTTKESLGPLESVEFQHSYSRSESHVVFLGRSVRLVGV